MRSIGRAAVGFVGAAACSQVPDALDGSVDASNDHTQIIDASRSDATDASSAAFCASNPTATFCDDFDDLDAAFAVRWTSASTSGDGSTVTRTNARAVSIPESAVFHVEAADADAASTALLQWKYGSPMPTLALDFDVYVVARPTSENVDLVDITLGNLEFRLLLTPSGDEGHELYTALDGGVSDIPWVPVQMIQAGAWHHVTLDIKLGSKGTNYLYYDSTLVHGEPLFGVSAPAAPDFCVGLCFEQAPRGAQDVNVDNVLIVLQ